jgi:hypothetical protein
MRECCHRLPFPCNKNEAVSQFECLNGHALEIGIGPDPNHLRNDGHGNSSFLACGSLQSPLPVREDPTRMDRANVLDRGGWHLIGTRRQSDVQKCGVRDSDRQGSEMPRLLESSGPG